MEIRSWRRIPHEWDWVSEWVKSLSRVQLFVTPWAVAYQTSLSVGFSRQEYWSGLPFPSPGNLPDPGIEPGSPALEADPLSHKGSPWIRLVLHKRDPTGLLCPFRHLRTQQKDSHLWPGNTPNPLMPWFLDYPTSRLREAKLIQLCKV